MQYQLLIRQIHYPKFILIYLFVFYLRQVYIIFFSSFKYLTNLIPPYIPIPVKLAIETMVNAIVFEFFNNEKSIS